MKIKCGTWYGMSKFRSGNTSLKDEPRPGCSSDLGQDVLRRSLEPYPHKNIQELTLDLNNPQFEKDRKSKKAGRFESSYS